MVTAEGLTKSFDGVKVVNQLDLSILPGEIYGLLGPNGAGKTTTVRMLCGLLAPECGRAVVAGYDVVKQPREARNSCALVPDRPQLSGYLSARENLWAAAVAYGVPLEVRANRIDELCAVLGLDELENRRAHTFSHGQQQKCALGGALVSAPEVLFLDEPTVALDAASASLIKEILQDFADNDGTVILTTHNLPAAEPLCKRIGIIHQGQMFATGTVEELRQEAGLSDQDNLEEVFLELTQTRTNCQGFSFLGTRGRG